MGAIARTDVELVEASRRGEREAFGHLVARYQDVVCAVSYSSTGDPGLSEDVAQETFIAAWRQLDRLRDSVRLRPWLCGIARNLGRKARKRKHLEELVDTDEQIATDGNPFDIAARSEVEQVVRDALARVPLTYRDVLVLFYREDQSIREVAETLGLSEAAVMQRLSRGRRYLADSVSEIVERSLRTRRPRRDLVAAVLAAIAVIPIPSRVDAAPMKGSTMLKFAAAASAVVAVGTTAYLVHDHRTAAPEAAQSAPVSASAPALTPVLRYGSGQLGLTRPPSLGPTAAPRMLQSRTVAEADLAYLPADADAVVGINLAQARQSPLWQRFIAPRIAEVDELRELATQCGFDPIASFRSATIGIKRPSSDNEDITGAIVVHGFEKSKALPCYDKIRDKNARMTVDGDVVLLADATGTDKTAFTFIDDTTALIVLGKDAATRQSVERIAAGKGTLATSSSFAATLQYINTDDSIWLAVSETSSIVHAINGILAEFTQHRLGMTYLALNVTDTIALDAGVHLGDPEQVASLVSTMQAQMEESGAKAEVSRYFDQLDVFADGSELVVSLAMTQEQLLGLLASGIVTVDMTTENSASSTTSTSSISVEVTTDESVDSDARTGGPS